MIEALFSYSYWHVFFFDYYPYICGVVFILGSALRYDKDAFSWKADSSQLLRRRGLIIGSNLFHIGILLLFLGHLVGLLTPHGFYELFITAAQKQWLAIIMGGIFGIICFIGLTMLIYRRLWDKRIRMTSRMSDILILLILYAQLILGLVTLPYSVSHSDGGNMLALSEWAQHIVTFRSGASDFIYGQAWVFKLHIILGCTIFLVFPFTRLVHVWSGFAAPFRYLLRSGYQIVRRR